MKPPAWTSRTATIIPPKRRDDIVIEDLDGEIIFSDPRSECIFHLNATALRIWAQCDGATSTREIARRLTEAWDVDTDSALDDVEQVIAFFAESGLLGAGGDACR